MAALRREKTVSAVNTRQTYFKRVTEFVVAVQVDLDTPGFTYQKWGGTQACKPGDWLVNNGGDTYTIDRDTFARTYRAAGPGTFVKKTPVWAEVARTAGSVRTKEGSTSYEPGDYLVYNEPDGGDAYAVSKKEFERMYVPAAPDV
jgi:hypothetical protein